MYKRNSIKKLGRKTAHRKSLIRNQLRSIIQSGKLKTSSVKAKVLKGELESILSRIKSSEEGDICLMRELVVLLGSKELARKTIEVGKKSDIKVCIKKVGFRVGDNSELSIVEILGFKTKVKDKKEAKDTKKVSSKENEKELPIEEDHKRGILNIGRKNIKDGVKPIKKERARSRAGI
jgi:large subunit ribosomal protein L17